MGNLKDKAANDQSEDVRKHNLTESEANYLRMLNLSLQYHTLSQKIQSGFLYYVAVNRLGYPNGSNLSFQFDFNDQNNVLVVQVISDEAAQQMIQPQSGQEE